MKRFERLAAFGLLAALLSGCGQAEPQIIEESTLIISGDGGVTAHLVEEFDRSYYDPTELAAMAQVEADLGEAFPWVDLTELETMARSAEGDDASADSGAVKLQGVETAQDGSSRIIVTFTFDSTDSYEVFTENREILFYGTVAEALARGYGSGVSLQSVNDGTVLTGAGLSQESDRMLVIYCPDQEDSALETGEEIHFVIYCPSHVEYVSQGASLNQDGSVDAFWVKGTSYTPVYLLLRK